MRIYYQIAKSFSRTHLRGNDMDLALGKCLASPLKSYTLKDQQLDF